MVDRPDRILIRCESCKRESTLSAIHRNQGACPDCQNPTWHIQVVYLARLPDGDATSLTLKALGIGLVNSSGESIGSPLPGEKRPVNGFDIHDVPASVMADLASPDVDPDIKLTAFVLWKNNEQFQQHRKAMEERGGECDQCGMLYVTNEQKPWTLLGTCSKVCCANKLGAVDYALVEEDVLDRTQGQISELRKHRRDHQAIVVTCGECGHRFELPKIYAGVQRKCPECDNKVKVPEVG